MDVKSANPIVEDLATKLKETERQLGQVAKECSRIGKALQKATVEFEKSPWPIRAMEALRKTLAKPIDIRSVTELDALNDLVEQSLASIKQGFDQQFRKQLKVSADREGLEFGTSAENVTLGPFELVIDRAKEVASLVYAKEPCHTGLPIEPEDITGKAKQLASELLCEREDLTTLSSQLEEAVFVSIARDKKSTRLPELRAELPAVYREMTFIRQAAKKPVSKQTFQDYPLARFVVEVASLVRSDANIASDRSFRLETAVIENAGNRRKAVFIPKDLRKGYGEGMYYQAILLRQTT